MSLYLALHMQPSLATIFTVTTTRSGLVLHSCLEPSSGYQHPSRIVPPEFCVVVHKTEWHVLDVLVCRPSSF